MSAAPKCGKRDCPRLGKNLWRASVYALWTRDGEKVPIITFACRPEGLPQHYLYQGPHGEKATRIQSDRTAATEGSQRGRRSAGRFLYKDAESGKTIETFSQLPEVLASAEYRNRKSRLSRQFRRLNPEKAREMDAKLVAISQSQTRRNEARAQMTARYQNQAARDRQAELTRENWRNPQTARKRKRGTKLALAKPEVKAKQKAGLVASHAKRKAEDQAIRAELLKLRERNKPPFVVIGEAVEAVLPRFMELCASRQRIRSFQITRNEDSAIHHSRFNPLVAARYFVYLESKFGNYAFETVSQYHKEFRLARNADVTGKP